MEQDIAKIAQGHWTFIHSSLGIPREAMTKTGKPCPMCNGHDRFTYDDKDGRGTYLCRHCGAGDGFTLLIKFNGWDFKKAAGEVRRVMGAEPVKPPTKILSNTVKIAKSLWSAASDNDTKVGMHSYARKKGIKTACGVRRGIATGSVIGNTVDCLIIPNRNIDGNLIGVECINPDGKKQTFGNKGMLILGNDLDPALTITVLEGWASAVAWLNFYQWNACAVVAFGKGSSERVAQQLVKKYPNHVVVIGEEDDD